MINCIVVDDEPHGINTLSRHIENTSGMALLNGYTNPLKALEAIRSGAVFPDLVFSDIDMPQMSGFELAESLPEHICVVLVSGSIDNVREAHEHGAADSLLKPVSDERFTASLNKVRPMIAAKSDFKQ